MVRNPWGARDAPEGPGKGKLLEVLQQIPCANADGATAGAGTAAKREPGELHVAWGARGALQPQGLRRRMLEEVRLGSCTCRGSQRGWKAQTTP